MLKLSQVDLLSACMNPFLGASNNANLKHQEIQNKKNKYEFS